MRPNNFLEQLKLRKTIVSLYVCEQSGLGAVTLFYLDTDHTIYPIRILGANWWKQLTEPNLVFYVNPLDGAETFEKHPVGSFIIELFGNDCVGFIASKFYKFVHCTMLDILQENEKIKDTYDYGVLDSLSYADDITERSVLQGFYESAKGNMHIQAMLGDLYGENRTNHGDIA